MGKRRHSHRADSRLRLLRCAASALGLLVVAPAAAGEAGTPATGQAPPTVEAPPAPGRDPVRSTSEADEGSDDPWQFDNPFATAYRQGPAWFRLGIQVGSVHREGIGPSLTFVPWEYTELTATYGYRTDHSVAGMLSVPVLPRALLSPYATVGYALAIASLPQGIRLSSHQLVAGVGLRARVLDRYVLGGEITGNGIVVQTLKDKETTFEIVPGERFTLQGGFHLGVSLP